MREKDEARSDERRSGRGGWRQGIGWAALGVAGWLWLGGRRRAPVLPPPDPVPIAPDPGFPSNRGWIAGPAGDLFLRSVEGEGRPLLFIHGLGGTSAVWEPVLSRLRGKAGGAAFDLGGHGRSAAVGSWTVEGATGEVDAVLGHLGWSRCTLVGHGLGAAVALGWAAARPGRAERVVILDPPVHRRHLGRGVDALVAAVREDPRPELALQLQPLMAALPTAVRERLRDELGSTEPEVLADGFEAQLEADLVAWIEDLTLPVECLLSADVAIRSPWLRASDVRTRVIDGASHWSMLDEPDRLLTALFA